MLICLGERSATFQGILSWLLQDWQLDVSGDEIIVRGITSPHHVNENKELISPAFEPTPGTDEISVMRILLIGSDSCKRRASALSNPSKAKVYQGLAALRVSAVKSNGALVKDSRSFYWGHADIKIGVVRPAKSDPPRPQDVKRLNEIRKALKGISKYYTDPQPTSNVWTGPAITPPD